MGAVALANTAKVGVASSAISTVIGPAAGVLGLMHAEVAGSVWHRLRVMGRSGSVVSAVTEIVAAAPTLMVAAVKKPLPLARRITPLLVKVADNAIRSGTGVGDADSRNVFSPTRLVFDAR